MSDEKTKTGIKNIAIGRSDLYRFDPADINVKDGLNSRAVVFNPNDEADIALAKSIAVNGIKSPVSVFVEGGQVFLADGHRRLAALAYAVEHLNVPSELNSVPAIREAVDADEKEYLFAQITRNAGKPFTALEQATVFKKLMALDMTADQIATKAGISSQRVLDLLALGKAPAKVKKMIEKGEISPTLAITTQKKAKGDGKKLTEALTNAVKFAKDSGKSKATAKHVSKDAAPVANPKSRLRALFSDISIKESEGGYIAYMNADEYAEVRSLIGF